MFNEIIYEVLYQNSLVLLLMF